MELNPGWYWCMDCHRGYFRNYVSDVETESCEGCPDGKYSSTTRSAHCYDCPPGTMAPIGVNASHCGLCASGRYQPLSGQTECHICENGRATGDENSKNDHNYKHGATTCEICPEGK